MADTKISALPATVTPANADEFPVNQAGTTKKTTLQQIKDFIEQSPIFAAGSATAGSWPKWTSGTLQTTPDAGSIEYDGNAFYGTSDAGNRGVIPLEHIIRADADRTLASQTAAQAIFNSPTNGRLTLETGTYLIAGLIHVNTMSATSGNAQFGLLGAGSATLGTQLFHIVGVDGNAATAATQTGSTTLGGNTSPASALTAGTAAAMTMNIRGSFEVTAAGTIVPSLALVTANAAVVKAGSYLAIRRIGSTSMVSVGQWD